MVTRVPQLQRVGGVVAVLAGICLAFTAPASAQVNPPNPGGSAVNQYVELVPAAAGPKAPVVEKKKKRAPLPAAGKKALKKAAPAVAKSLEEIATLSTYGAPATRAEPEPTKPAPTAAKPKPKPNAKPTTAKPQEPVRERDDTAADVTLGATVRAIASATDGRLLGLLLTVLVTTFGAVGLAARRARIA